MTDQTERDEQVKAEHALEQAEAPDFARFLREYGRPVLLGIGVAVAAFLAVTYYRATKARTAADADRMLMTGNPDQLKALIAQYPGTPAAPAALLLIARQAYESGQFEEARGLYSQFAQNHAAHPSAPAARLNQIICVEALGRIDEAQAAYQDFRNKYGDHYLAPQAIFGEARCLEQKGQYAGARAMYEDFKAAHPASPWSRICDAAIDGLDMKIRAAKSAVVQPKA